MRAPFAFFRSVTPSVTPSAALLAAALACASSTGAAAARDAVVLSVTPGAATGSLEIVFSAGAAPPLRADGAPVSPASAEPAGEGRVRVTLAALPAGASRLEVGRSGAKNFEPVAAVQLAPAPAQAAPFADWVVYHVYLATFRSGSRENDGAVKGWRDPRYAGGDLHGLAGALDHVKATGANAIWISPMFAADTSHGYDVLDYFSIGEAVGVPGDPAASRRLWDELVRGAKERGLRLVLDVPLNHAHKGYRLPQGDPKKLRPRSSGPRQQAEKVWESWGASYRYWTHEDARTRAFLADVARYWLANGADGLRLDYVRGAPHSFWAELYAGVKKDFPRAFLVGEAWMDAENAERNAREIATYWAPHEGRRQFDALFDFPLQEAMTDVFARGEDAARLEDLLQVTAALYGKDAYPAYFLDNHDLSRFMDWAGDKKRLLAALTFMASLSGPQVIFYGTETALAGGQAKPGFTDSGRVPFPWDRVDREFMGRVAEVYKTRAAHEDALARGGRLPLFADRGALVMAKTGEKKTILVAVNTGTAAREVEVPAAGGAPSVILGDAKAARDEKTGRVRLTLPPMTTSFVAISSRVE